MPDEFLKREPIPRKEALTPAEQGWVRRRMAENRSSRCLTVILIAAVLLIAVGMFRHERWSSGVGALIGTAAAAGLHRIHRKTRRALAEAMTKGRFADNGIRLETSGRRPPPLCFEDRAGLLYTLKRDVWTLLDPGDTVEMQIAPGGRLMLSMEPDGRVRMHLGPVRP